MPIRSYRKRLTMAFKIKKVKPLFTGVITTAITYKGEVTTSGGIILDTRKMDGSLNPYQTVIAVGSTSRGLKEGDVVKINFKRYTVAKHVPGAFDEAENKTVDNYSQSVEVPMIVMNDIEYLFIQDSDIEYIVEDYEVDEGGLLQ